MPILVDLIDDLKQKLEQSLNTLGLDKFFLQDGIDKRTNPNAYYDLSTVNPYAAKILIFVYLMINFLAFVLGSEKDKNKLPDFVKILSAFLKPQIFENFIRNINSLGINRELIAQILNLSAETKKFISTAIEHTSFANDEKFLTFLQKVSLKNFIDIFKVKKTIDDTLKISLIKIEPLENLRLALHRALEVIVEVWDANEKNLEDASTQLSIKCTRQEKILPQPCEYGPLNKNKTMLKVNRNTLSLIYTANISENSDPTMQAPFNKELMDRVNDIIIFLEELQKNKKTIVDDFSKAFFSTMTDRFIFNQIKSRIVKELKDYIEDLEKKIKNSDSKTVISNIMDDTLKNYKDVINHLQEDNLTNNLRYLFDLLMSKLGIFLGYLKPMLNEKDEKDRADFQKIQAQQFADDFKDSDIQNFEALAQSVDAILFTENNDLSRVAVNYEPSKFSENEERIEQLQKILQQHITNIQEKIKHPTAEPHTIPFELPILSLDLPNKEINVSETFLQETTASSLTVADLEKHIQPKRKKIISYHGDSVTLQVNGKMTLDSSYKSIAFHQPYLEKLQALQKKLEDYQLRREEYTKLSQEFINTYQLKVLTIEQFTLSETVAEEQRLEQVKQLLQDIETLTIAINSKLTTVQSATLTLRIKEPFVKLYQDIQFVLTERYNHWQKIKDELEIELADPELKELITIIKKLTKQAEACSQQLNDYQSQKQQLEKELQKLQEQKHSLEKNFGEELPDFSKIESFLLESPQQTQIQFYKENSKILNTFFVAFQQLRACYLENDQYFTLDILANLAESLKDDETIDCLKGNYKKSINDIIIASADNPAELYARLFYKFLSVLTEIQLPDDLKKDIRDKAEHMPQLFFEYHKNKKLGFFAISIRNDINRYQEAFKTLITKSSALESQYDLLLVNKKYTLIQQKLHETCELINKTEQALADINQQKERQHAISQLKLTIILKLKPLQKLHQELSAKQAEAEKLSSEITDYFQNPTAATVVTLQTKLQGISTELTRYASDRQALQPFNETELTYLKDHMHVNGDALKTEIDTAYTAIEKVKMDWQDGLEKITFNHRKKTTVKMLESMEDYFKRRLHEKKYAFKDKLSMTFNCFFKSIEVDIVERLKFFESFKLALYKFTCSQNSKSIEELEQLITIGLKKFRPRSTEDKDKYAYEQSLQYVLKQAQKEVATCKQQEMEKGFCAASRPSLFTV